MLKTLLSAAGATALIAGTAMAGPLTPDAARSMSPEQLKEAISKAEFIGYRMIADDCGNVSCAATSDGRLPAEFLDAMRQAAADGEGSANAPRADFSADSVFFQGRGPIVRRTRGQPQTVFLNFDNQGSETFFVDVVDPQGNLLNILQFNDFVFTPEQQEEIRDRIAADYAEFDFEVTLDRPASEDVSILDFTDNDRTPGSNNIELVVFPDGGVGFSILFGRAEGIDFGNDDLGTGSFADANFFQVLADLFTTESFERIAGVPADLDGDGVTDIDAVNFATVNQAANTGAHEVGHTVGLRHHDAFGAPGDGLPDTGRPDPTTFIPVYEGPTNGSEAIFHLMASGASVGTRISDSSSRDRFFSERSALKLKLAEEARIYDEGKLRSDRGTHAKNVRLIPTLVPNTLEAGENSGSRFIKMDTAWIQGSVEAQSVDEYKFRAGRSMFVNAELISFSDSFIEEPVIAELNLFKLERDGTRTLISSNNQTFEPFDPLLVDIELPSDGEYVIQVATPDIIYLDLDGDGVAADSLIDAGFGELLSGDYDLLVYQVDRPLGRIPAVDGKKADRIASR